MEELYQGEKGKALRKHLQASILALDTIEDIDKSDKDMIAIQVLAKEMAMNTLKEILNLTEPEQEKPQLQDKAKKYGLQ
jgi:hypothetical protein